MSINAVKGIEFGSGFNLVELDGTNASDQMSSKDKKISFHSNHAGYLEEFHQDKTLFSDI